MSVTKSIIRGALSAGILLSVFGLTAQARADSKSAPGAGCQLIRATGGLTLSRHWTGFLSVAGNYSANDYVDIVCPIVIESTNAVTKTQSVVLQVYNAWATKAISCSYSNRELGVTRLPSYEATGASSPMAQGFHAISIATYMLGEYAAHASAVFCTLHYNDTLYGYLWDEY